MHAALLPRPFSAVEKARYRGRKGDSSGRGTRDGPTTAKGEGEKGKGKKGGEGSEKKIQGRSRKERYNRERLT